MNDLDKAREWAGRVYAQEPDTQATCRVIQSLPDEWIDAEKLRKVVDDLHPELKGGDIEQALLHLLPTPQPRTLADMSFEELKDYIGEKVTVDGWANPSMLVAVIGDEGAVLAHRLNKPWPFVEVRPLSDLAPVAAPEQEWPSLSVSDKSEPVSVETEDVTEESDPAQEPQPVVKTLRTVEDYEAASIGTVVRRQELPWLAATFHKRVDGIWNSTGDHEYPPSEMAGTARTVLWEPKP